MPKVTYQVVEYPPDAEQGYRGYGAIEKLWAYKGPEALLSGPAETGKTRGGLEKLDTLMWLYPGAQAAIVRKTRASMTGSVLQTWETKVLQAGAKVHNYGGSHVEYYQYPTGSRVYVGGMDNPDKLLSSERDFIYVNQAEELTLDDWEKLCTRATGRAGNSAYAQVFGDCNPGSQFHWIKQREQSGRLKIFESRHEDNPVLFDPNTHQITGQGKRTMDVLDALTGVRHKRLRLGLWVAAEGQVYSEWDPAVHLIDRFDIPKEWPRFRDIDFGFTNPFCCHWWAADPDNRLYMYREIYMTGRLVEDHATDILRLSEGERIEWTTADHDAEDRATLERRGIHTRPAKKDVSPGIQAVAARLRKAGDGKPRLFILRDSLVERDRSLVEKRKPTCTAEEFEGYVWQQSADGKPLKEQPLKADDHGMDGLRYQVMGHEPQQGRGVVGFR